MQPTPGPPLTEKEKRLLLKAHQDQGDEEWNKVLAAIRKRRNGKQPEDLGKFIEHELEFVVGSGDQAPERRYYDYEDDDRWLFPERE